MPLTLSKCLNDHGDQDGQGEFDSPAIDGHRLLEVGQIILLPAMPDQA